MNQFLEDLKENFHRKRLFRWLIFTYPKTATALGLGLTSWFIYVGAKEVNEASEFQLSFNETIHSKSNQTKRNNKIVVYDGTVDK